MSPVAWGLTIALAITLCACSQPHQQPDGTGASRADGRQLVPFPDAMRVQTLANMRDHLLAIQQINDALSRSEFEKAAGIAEKRLGMTSLEAHDASHLARLMPQGMQDIGSQMHRAASRFSIEAQNATATNDVRPVLAALNPVLQQCAACHATYRLQ